MKNAAILLNAIVATLLLAFSVSVFAGDSATTKGSDHVPFRLYADSSGLRSREYDRSARGCYSSRTTRTERTLSSGFGLPERNDLRELQNRFGHPKPGTMPTRQVLLRGTAEVAITRLVHRSSK